LDLTTTRPLVSAFSAHYGRRPRLVLRSPGRVNLIGEHTDYSLLPVLPMAIDRANYFALTKTDDGVVRVASTAEAMRDSPATLDRRGLRKSIGAEWHRYLAGALAELEGLAPGLGALVLVDGDLPHGGGLSSSSSLTLGLLAGLCEGWGEKTDLDWLVERALAAERAVGVECGGMDQNVIAHGRKDHALRIDFAPALRRHVALPVDLALVIAFSGTSAPKGSTAQRSYNERVIGCRLAAHLLAGQLGHRVAPGLVLGHLVQAIGISALVPLVETLPLTASPALVARETGVPAAQLGHLTGSEFPANDAVSVRSLARHVLSETIRVDRAEHTLIGGNLDAFGQLLDQSQASLADDFGCSTPGLDRLCLAMRKAGALGARLTGAGFGGYALAAVLPSLADAVRDAALSACGGPAMIVSSGPGLTITRVE
jgi:galactokinase